MYFLLCLMTLSSDEGDRPLIKKDVLLSCQPCASIELNEGTHNSDSASLNFSTVFLLLIKKKSNTSEVIFTMTAEDLAFPVFKLSIPSTSNTLTSSIREWERSAGSTKYLHEHSITPPLLLHILSSLHLHSH